MNRLGTLTYRGDGLHDPKTLRVHVGVFFRQLRSALDGKPLPYLWVPEWHASGHGLHVHFAVGQYVPRGLIDRAWGHGFVHIKRLSDMPVGSGRRAESRRAAGYLSKYVSKTFGHDLGGLHRYEVAQGFQPRPTRLTGTSSQLVLGQAASIMGSAPDVAWSSLDAEDWQGPPAVWCAWD